LKGKPAATTKAELERQIESYEHDYEYLKEQHSVPQPMRLTISQDIGTIERLVERKLGAWPKSL